MSDVIETIKGKKLGHLTVLSCTRQYPPRQVTTIDKGLHSVETPKHTQLKIICEGGVDEGAFIPDQVWNVHGSQERIISQLKDIVAMLEEESEAPR